MNKENPKVSIIIPVYNTEEYLRECLNSVINQTLKDIEIILIDDGSTDNSGKICDEYKEKDSRITVIHQKNLGHGKARNEGLKIANGQYLGFVDSDDYIDLDFYEKLYKKATETNADIVKANVKKVDFNGNITTSYINQKLIQTKNKWFFYYQWCSAIYKTKMIKENNIKFSESLIYAEDSLFLHYALEQTRIFEFINDTYYYYLRRKNSLNSEILSYKKVISALTFTNKVSENINKMYISNSLNKENYCYLCNVIIYILIKIFYRSNSQSSKIKCSEHLINFYNNCLEKNSIKTYLYNKYPIIAKAIINNNSEKTYNILSKIKDYNKLRKKNKIQNSIFFLKYIKSKLIYLIYLILLKLGIKDKVKNFLKKIGFVFNE